ncbi:MAG: DUF2723 domain-containing protein [Paramuribaculum sp.]|nr:DUF2723 domain-containing protein [Paramuribaculum sp.]
MKRYNLLNNTIGWACFLIAAVTYLLTLEPTASFWDCPEFIIQGTKLEVGHPPGNPIFMLTARFFVNFAMGDLSMAAWWVNAMSALLSAATILLLFWTVTHLVKRLIVKDSATEITPLKMLVIFGSGICGALMYAWSDTFWFSAVEAEVYAFSSFCTALVFWLILKWENRADRPSSDKYLLLILYVIGISIAVHLLNLLCIPAIVLVIFFRKAEKVNLKRTLVALLISFVLVGLILYGLVPGFVEMAQYFEFLFVNSLGMSFNAGVLIYAILTVGFFAWTIFNVYKKGDCLASRLTLYISLILSGIFMIGDSWWVPTLLLIGCAVFLIVYKQKIPVRVLNLVATGILVIFIGYSSYALLLIRSTANTPMNQNDPDNVFALDSYLNREQYGDRPLIYGETLLSPYAVVYEETPSGDFKAVMDEGPAQYAPEVKADATKADRYVFTGNKHDYTYAPELNMLFPRIYSGAHAEQYASWIGGGSYLGAQGQRRLGDDVQATYIHYRNGQTMTKTLRKPTFGENLKFFFNYQLNHMYWRYFMWNFAGRQNDIQGSGEPTRGNWISGIPFIDDVRLGDQSLLPDELDKDNPGHNVFFLIPLIMGLMGLLFQASAGKRGIEQFWVIFFLFFMTGVAIVLYLNQTPSQPRERDYAFAGSFYAYAIWVGMGVAGLWHMIYTFSRKGKDKYKEEYLTEEPGKESKSRRIYVISAVVAAVVGILVPLQVVSQTWDDHDRSGRTAARDFGMNYLNSLDPNAIIFTYGDNDTFPLWYAQEVEGVRTDVKVVNLSYLTTDWYINQLLRPSYDAMPVNIQAPAELYAYNKHPYFFINTEGSKEPVVLSDALANLYANLGGESDTLRYPVVKIPANGEAAVANGVIDAALLPAATDIIVDLSGKRSIYINNLMVLDLISTSAARGWDRPIYFASTVPSEYYLGLDPYFAQTGLAYQVTPVIQGKDAGINTAKMYDNIVNKWKWGGLDKAKSSKDIYLDETVRRMVTSNRQAMLELAYYLSLESMDYQEFAQLTEDKAEADSLMALSSQAVDRAKEILALQEEKLPSAVMAYTPFELQTLQAALHALYEATADPAVLTQLQEVVASEAMRYAAYVRYYDSLSPDKRSLLSSYDRLGVQLFDSLLRTYSNIGGDTKTLIEQVRKEYGFTPSMPAQN